MSTFTKQHYIVIAKIIRRARPLKEDSAAYIANDLAEYFIKDNPRFDAHKFIVACGFKPRV